MTDHLPRGAGTAVFAGGGAWLAPPLTGDEAVVLLSTRAASWWPQRPTRSAGLLDEVEAEQKRGNYVAGYLAYEAGRGLRAHRAAHRPPDALPLAWMAVYPPESATVIAAGEWQRLLDQVDVSRVARR